MNAVWRIRCGLHGWIRNLNPDGTPTITADQAEAMWWETKTEAQAVIERLPSSPVSAVAVPGQPIKGGPRHRM